MGCCFRDLSTLPSTSGFTQLTPPLPNRVRIDIHFNFASLKVFFIYFIVIKTFKDISDDDVSPSDNETSRRFNERLVKQHTPPLQSDRLTKAEYDEQSRRLQTQYSSKSPELTLDVTPRLDLEPTEGNSTLLLPTVNIKYVLCRLTSDILEN